MQKSMMLSELLAFAQNWGILQTRMDQRGDHIKTNFDYFQIKKWMLQTVRAEKLDKKIVVIGLISMFPTWVMVCKLSKKVHFLQFCADLSKKFKSVETFTYMHLKVLITLFQKMLWFLGVWASVHKILAIKISKTMLTQQKFLKNYSTWNTHTIETVSHSIINNINFWKCITRPFRCIYVNCFNQLWFLAEVSTKL